MICVVDDNPSVRKALKRLLSSAGYEVATFGSAEEVLTSDRGELPGVLVIDVRMPGLSGLELQRLAASGSRVPIVFITAYRDDQARTLAQQAGAVAYLEKPVDGGVLLGAIRAGLERQTFEAPEAERRGR
jgi:FixJ family two-component response regulator